MENLLIATDFSENASNAVEFGNNLALQLKANILLAQAFIIPAQTPQGGVLVWPQFQYDETREEYETKLKELKERLDKKNQGELIKPEISFITDAGTLESLVAKISTDRKIGVAIMGTHGSSNLEGFLFGDHSKKMIDKASIPLLLVPGNAVAGAIKKIAFATDFTDIHKDWETIYGLIPFLKQLQAELVLVHIYDEKGHTAEYEKQLKKFLAEVAGNLNYDHVDYRIIKSHEAEKGLNWFCHFGKIDMLVMVHRKHSFAQKLFNGSHARKVEEHISVPLLVMPAH